MPVICIIIFLLVDWLFHLVNFTLITVDYLTSFRFSPILLYQEVKKSYTATDKPLGHYCWIWRQILFDLFSGLATPPRLNQSVFIWRLFGTLGRWYAQHGYFFFVFLDCLSISGFLCTMHTHKSPLCAVQIPLNADSNKSVLVAVCI